MHATATSENSGRHFVAYLVSHAVSRRALCLRMTLLPSLRTWLMQFERQLPPCRLYDVPCRSIQSTLDKWVVVTTDEVKRLIKAAPNETSRLDPAPTWLVKDMRGLLAPFLTLLFNRSLSTGCFPSEFKLAIVCPLLKKSGLDAEDPKNRRSVSTLSFFSKLLERNAQRQLQAYLNNNDLMPTPVSYTHLTLPTIYSV